MHQPIVPKKRSGQSWRPPTAGGPVCPRHGHQPGDGVPGACEVGDALGQPVALLRHPLEGGMGVLLAGRIDARQQFGDGAAGHSCGEQSLDEHDPLDVLVRVVPLPAACCHCGCW
jgi:hypothetical protein